MNAFRHPAVILLVLGGLAFAAVPTFELVWDDAHYLVQGTALTQAPLAQLLTSDWSLEGARSGYYRPLVTLTLAIEARLFGAQAAGYHVMNVIYHLAAALALAWAARRVLGSSPAAWIAGLAFVLHPIHTESVAWVSGRTDVIATLFFCLAVGCHLRAARIRSPWTLGALAAGAAAMLSKEPAITLPAVLLAGEWCRPRELRTSAVAMVLRVLPMTGLAVGYLGLRTALLGSATGSFAGWAAWSERLASGVAVIGRYLVLLIAPFPANPDYVLDSPSSWTAWPPLAALATLAALAGLATWAWRRSRLPAFLLAWLVLTLLPSTPLLPVGPVHMAERFLYLPSAALAMAMGWGAAYALARAGLRNWTDLNTTLAPRQVAVAATLALLAIAGLGMTAYRSEDWRDADRLFSRMAASSPRSWKAALGLGHVYQGRGDLLAAAAEYRRAMELEPGAVAPVISLAMLESRLGLHARAVSRAEDARRLDPDGEMTHLQRAWIYSNAGEHRASAAAFEDAARRNPRRVETRQLLALELARASLREAADRAPATGARAGTAAPAGSAR